jgi:O-succinylbenzoic acid--CoA ligase
LPTGDEGRLDDTGRLEVFGRRGDVIVTGGEKVWPAAVEAALAAHPGVAAVAVVGRPDEEWGAAVTALVEPRDPGHPPTLEDLREHVRRTLPAYAAPKRLELCDALPRTALGKVRRRGL